MAEGPRPSKRRRKEGEPAAADANKPILADLHKGLENIGTLLGDLENIPSVGATCNIVALEPSSTVLGRGSGGTMVLEGLCKGQKVAIKRLVQGHVEIDQGIEKFMSNLENRHDNVVHYHLVTRNQHFVYVAQELCSCSLNDLVQALSPSIDISVFPDGYRQKLANVKAKMQHVKLWSALSKRRKKKLRIANDPPTLQLLNLIRDVVSGIAHLHTSGIFHENLKPQNVLITKTLSAKISDVGILKCIHGNESSLPGFGWQAPEVLLPGGCQTAATNMFTLGCIIFFCITGGDHPFGKHRVREINIEKNTVDLSSVTYIPEAHDLISSLLSTNPALRPEASKVLHHPFFWSSKMRLSFLRKVSNKVDKAKTTSPLLIALEKTAATVFDVDWISKINTHVMAFLVKRRNYENSMKDLLRAVRECLKNHGDAPRQAQLVLGPVPEGLDTYFAALVPMLLMETFKVVSRLCKHEVCFRKFFLSL